MAKAQFFNSGSETWEGLGLKLGLEGGGRDKRIKRGARRGFFSNEGSRKRARVFFLLCASSPNENRLTFIPITTDRRIPLSFLKLLSLLISFFLYLPTYLTLSFFSLSTFLTVIQLSKRVSRLWSVVSMEMSSFKMLVWQQIRGIEHLSVFLSVSFFACRTVISKRSKAVISKQWNV